jgi:hypothetical protein
MRAWRNGGVSSSPTRIAPIHIKQIAVAHLCEGCTLSRAADEYFGHLNLVRRPLRESTTERHTLYQNPFLLAHLGCAGVGVVMCAAASAHPAWSPGG